MNTNQRWCMARRIGYGVLLLGCSLGTAPAQAQQPADEADVASAVEQDPSDVSADDADQDSLSQRQRQLSARYRRFEEVLLRLAEVTAQTDPKRAALMRKAAAQSKERLIGVQLERLVELVESRQFANALRNQTEVREELLDLLGLLLEENRDALLESERQRYRRYLKTLNRVIQRQEAVEGQTRRGRPADDVAKRQGQLAEETGDLTQAMKNDRAAQSEAARARGGDAQSESDPQGGAGGEAPEGDAETPPSESPSGQAKPGSSGDAGDSSAGEGAAENPQGEAEQRLEAAEKRMREAQQRLEDAQREDAADAQAEALEALNQAKRELERILRQMRQEEIQRKLAQLESRFRKMLAEEREIYEKTSVIDSIAPEERGRNEAIEAGRIAQQQAKVVIQADTVLELLRDDGTAVAMPEAVRQMRGDMQQVADRLADADVGEITQAIEQDILDALAEILSALEKAKQDAAAGESQPGQGQGGDEEKPLVDQLAELKMIRALQMRVNRRTEIFTNRIDGEQAESEEAIEALVELAERQRRIEQATRDIVAGRNR